MIETSKNPTMKWHRGLKDSNTVKHPPMSLGRRYYRESLKREIKRMNQRIKNDKRRDTRDTDVTIKH